MLEYVMRIIVGIYLVVMAVVDGRKKCIPVLPGVVCLICIVAVQLINQTPWQVWLFGGIVGLVLYGIAKVSRGSLGEGDALVYGLLGGLFGVTKTTEVLLIALFLCSLYSACLLLIYHVGKRHKIAFIPFTAMAYGVVMFV